MFLNFLHGRLGVERVDNSLKLIEPGRVWDAFTWVLGVARKLESVRSVECRRRPDLARNLIMLALQCRLFGVCRLLARGLGSCR